MYGIQLIRVGYITQQTEEIIGQFIPHLYLILEVLKLMEMFRLVIQTMAL